MRAITIAGLFGLFVFTVCVSGTPEPVQPIDGGYYVWEEVDQGNGSHITRLSVDGGWVIMVNEHSMSRPIFLPDPGHEWKLT